MGALTAASTGGDALEGAIEGFFTGAVAAAVAVYVPWAFPALSATASTVTTITAACILGTVVDGVVQFIAHFLREGNTEEFKLDLGRMFKTGVMTGVATAVPVVDPTFIFCVVAFFSSVIVADAAVINAIFEIIFNVHV